MRAPRGSKKVMGQVEAYIRNHPQRSAKYLGISESYARKIQRHVKMGKPLAEVVKTSRTVDKWRDRLATARQLTRAERIANDIKAAGLKSTDIAEAGKLDPKEVYRNLRRMRKGKLVKPETVKAIQAASESVKRQEPYLKEGVTIYPSKDILMRDVEDKLYPQAISINRFSPFQEDILQFIKTISTQYFVAVFNASQEMYFVWDIRSEQERRLR